MYIRIACGRCPPKASGAGSSSARVAQTKFVRVGAHRRKENSRPKGIMLRNNFKVRLTICGRLEINYDSIWPQGYFFMNR